MDDEKSRDLKDLVKEESRRGGRPIDIGTIRLKREGSLSSKSC
jgi:hypothetical protein